MRIRAAEIFTFSGSEITESSADYRLSKVTADDSFENFLGLVHLLSAGSRFPLYPRYRLNGAIMSNGVEAS